MDQSVVQPLRTCIMAAEKAEQAGASALEQAQLKHQVAKSNYDSARETFENWLATRHATQRPEQDTELLTRTRSLDRLKEQERAAKAAVDAQDQAMLDARQRTEKEQ